MNTGVVFLQVIGENSIESTLEKIGLIYFENLENDGHWAHRIKAKNKHTCDFLLGHTTGNILLTSNQTLSIIPEQK